MSQGLSAYHVRTDINMKMENVNEKSQFKD